MHRLGHLYVYRSADSLGKDHFAWELRPENGVEIDEFDADELRQLEPALSRDYVRGVLVRENGHTSNPLKLVARLLEHFLCSSGEIVHARAHGFRLDGRRLAATQIDSDDHAADAAIVCAGAYSKPLAASVGDARDRARLPPDDRRSGGDAAHPNRRCRRQVVATPMATGLRFAGTVELAGLAAPPDWRRAHILLAQGRKMLPGLAASHPEERISVWMGHRPSLPDSLPVLGPSRTTPDVVYAFGHGHAGMTAAPMTGNVVADLVAGRLPSIDIASFAAGRFS